LTLFTTLTLASSNSALPDEGDYTETCRSCFNVNFNTPFKSVLLCISWWENFDAKQICSQLSFGQDTFLPFIEYGNILSLSESPTVHSILRHFSLHYHTQFKTDFYNFPLHIFMFLQSTFSLLQPIC